jgi:hypothetical protein
VILIFLSSYSFGVIKDKDSNDVYAQAYILKSKIVHLAGEKNIKAKYMKLPTFSNKSPRHVFQKSLEVLKKINKYRENTNLGEVNVPLYSSKVITSEDVYLKVLRLNQEIDLLLENVSCPHIAELSKTKIYTNKNSNDNYRELWSASLAMDELLGKGFTPIDTYEQAVLIIDTIKFIRNSQNIYEDIPKPKKKNRKHPNHVLYATNKLLEKISKAEKKLWMEPVDVPENPQRIITPTEVYDSMQTIITELVRIRKRLGIERFYEAPVIEEFKTPSDVLQEVEYAIALFPEFKLDKNLIQFDPSSLKKSVNEVYGLSQFVLEKINKLKNIKGIKVEPKKLPYIYNLNEMHVYQKSIETMEKINKLRQINGLYKVAVPTSPNKKKDTNEVYEMLLMIDDEISIILKKNGVKNVQKWSYKVEKNQYSNKTFSDIFLNLWKSASLIDTFRGETYTLKETLNLAFRIEQRVHNIAEYLSKGKVKHDYKKHINKNEKDVFSLTINIYDSLIKILKRANISGGAVDIPEEKSITPDAVHNALRVVNASLIDLNIHFGIDTPISKSANGLIKAKSYTEIYTILDSAYTEIGELLEDSSYED